MHKKVKQKLQRNQTLNAKFKIKKKKTSSRMKKNGKSYDEKL